ncbi:MAG TPA: biopolymer transporter ExbD [Sulfurospirillum sp. UBA11407]|jgi:biopolymer transport protein ExbD|nr:MAG TPA: biopolymer transporter ExbD [Sulfurospirillum sp. UBA11407]DAB33480.1 MAG TPA: biopolymer transporter ExbD [Sulfurospirillum sp. UBA12182]
MKSLKRVEGINVVPLIDIMLVLLTIVLTISSFIALGKIELTLPSGSAQEKMQPKSYDIAISSQREFYVNGNKIEKDSLEQKFLEITKNDTVTIRADKLTPYEEFVFIIDVLKQKGIEKIGMVVQDE